MYKIKEYFDAITEISSSDWVIFSSKLEKQIYSKKTKLLKAGKVENYLSFIEKGVVRYFIPGIENDTTFDFGFENEFISGYDSFLTGQPTLYHIETLSETILWRMTYADLQEVYSTTRAGNIIGRFAAEQLYLKKTKREKSFLNENAEERYLKLIKEQKKLIINIPLKHIASYIGITPQALSRIRRRIS